MKCFSSMLLVVFILLSYLPALSADSFKVGIFPRRSAEMTLKMFTPLKNKLETELNMPVQLMYSKSPQDFWKKVASKTFDLVQLDHFQYTVAHKKFAYQVIAQNVEFGRNTVSSVIYVRKDSGIKNVSDLKGKKILFSMGKKAFVPYIAPTAILKEAGLQSGDYEELFAQSPVQAMKAVSKGMVDAAIGADITLDMKMIKDSVDTTALTKLAEIGPFPHIPWAVSGNLDENQKNKVKDTLLSLHKTEDGRNILKAAALNNIIEAGDNDYDVVRDVAKNVIAQK